MTDTYILSFLESLKPNMTIKNFLMTYFPATLLFKSPHGSKGVAITVFKNVEYCAYSCFLVTETVKYHQKQIRPSLNP